MASTVHSSDFFTPAVVFRRLVYITHRHLRNYRFLRRVNGAHLSRLQRAKVAGQRSVQCDLADFEARSREAYRTGTKYFLHESQPQLNFQIWMSNSLNLWSKDESDVAKAGKETTFVALHVRIRRVAVTVEHAWKCVLMMYPYYLHYVVFALFHTFTGHALIPILCAVSWR